MRRALVALVVALACWPAPARAAHRRAVRYPCHEVSQVVGRERCARFGDWSPSPWLRLTWSLGVGRLETTQGPGSTLDASMSTPMSQLATAPPPQGHLFDLFEARSTVGFGRTLEIGPLLQVGRATDASDVLAIGGGMSGLVDLRLSWALIKPGIYVGARMMGRTQRPEDASRSTNTVRVVVEPRVSLELPLSPWIALGVTLGVDVAHHEERSGSAYLLFRTPSLGL